MFGVDLGRNPGSNSWEANTDLQAYGGVASSWDPEVAMAFPDRIRLQAIWEPSLPKRERELSQRCPIILPINASYWSPDFRELISGPLRIR